MRISKKKDLFEEIRLKLVSQGFRIVDHDDQQAWGGSLLIDEAQASIFLQTYFKQEASMAEATLNLPLRPKLLVVAPHQAISWQYHLRRAELWQVVLGEIGVKLSDSDEEPDPYLKKKGDFIMLQPGMRHRLVGLQDWAIIAQVWQHVDGEHPSDERDIVRLLD